MGVMDLFQMMYLILVELVCLSRNESELPNDNIGELSFQLSLVDLK